MNFKVRLISQPTSLRCDSGIKCDNVSEVLCTMSGTWYMPDKMVADIIITPL
jgi:hypothetical protein